MDSNLIEISFLKEKPSIKEEDIEHNERRATILRICEENDVDPRFMIPDTVRFMIEVATGKDVCLTQDPEVAQYAIQLRKFFKL